MRSDFVRNVATLMSGRGIAAAIAIFTMPIVSRLFTPEDFGAAAMFLSITALTITVSTMRYELALVLPKQESEALALLDFVYRFLTAFCVVLLLLVALRELSTTRIAALDILGGWIWLLPLSVFLVAAIDVQEVWLTRNKAFRVSSMALVTGNAFTSGTRILFGTIFGSSVGGLLIGYLLGSAARLAIQMQSTLPHFRVFQKTQFAKLLQIGQRYSDFPKMNAPAGLVFSLGANLPILLFAFLFHPEVVGFYAMAHRLAEVPLSIVANSIRAVFLQKAADIDSRAGDLRRAFVQTVAGLALIGVFPALVVWFTGQPILIWFLGERWAVAGQFFEVLAGLLFAGWVASATGPIFIVLRKQSTWLFLQAFMMTLRLGAFGVAFMIGADPNWTLRAFVAATIFGYAAEMIMAFKITSRKQSKA